MQFVVRHVPAGAKSVMQETLQATSAAELQQRLLATGSVVLELRRTGDWWPRPGQRGFDVPWWCRELETLLRAGMTAVEAIDTLAADTHDPERSRVHGQLLRALHEGAPLSRAMRLTDTFPEVLLAGVAASERTGTLQEALRDYLRYDELLQRLRRQVVSAALYPALVVALGGLVSVFLLLYVIPRFSRMYGGLHAALSPSTELVLLLSRFLREQWGVMLLLLLAAAWLLARAAASGQLLRAAAAVVEAVGPLRRQWDEFRLAKLFQSLALLFRGGYSFDEALAVCAGLNLGPRMAAGIALARELIARGKPASAALAAAGLTEITTERLLRVGERTGGFDTVLQTIAERHAQVFALFIERATRVVEPVLLLLVALVVGGLVVMMYMPIFDIAGGLGASR